MKYSKHSGWLLLLSIAVAVIVGSSCSSKKIQTATSHKDSTVVHKVSHNTVSSRNTIKNRVSTDHSKTKEKVKEVTVVEFDTTGSRNGTAEDFTNGIKEDAWSLKQARIKRITHTKTTTRQIAADKRDSSAIVSSTTQGTATATTDSTRLVVDTKTRSKKVFNWNWLFWLLVIPTAVGIRYIYKRFA